MKVLMVSPTYLPLVGGTESLIENVTIQLNRIGISTDVMTFNERFTQKGVSTVWKKTDNYVNGVRVIRIPALNLFFKKYPFNFRVNRIPERFADEFKNYDIIHFHSDIDLSFPLFSYFAKKPKIFHSHTLDVTYSFYKTNFIAGHIFRNIADLYIAISKSIYTLLVKLSIPRTRIAIVPNCIDVKEFKPGREPKIDNLLLFVGRLEERKGVHVLLESLNNLSTPVHLVIIGRPMNSKYLAKILALIDMVNRKSIHKATYLGVQERDKLIAWYQKASIFICPSSSEPFGIVNLEALSCETPVVASNVGGIPEVVLHNQNGILVRPNDAVQLSEAIQFLLDNERVRQKYGKHGRKWVMEQFSSEAIVEKLCTIYQKALPEARL